MDIAQIQQQISEASDGSQSLPPVDKWNPDFCGDMNLVIKRDGQWWHEGTPFTRAKLVKLFSSILKKEDNNYFLVTPVEKIGIQVEDVPFVIIDANTTEQGIVVTTQTGDTVFIGAEHPVELREYENTVVPYCLIRRNLWARVHQNVLYRWVELANTESRNGTNFLVLSSADYQFDLGEF